MILFAVLLSCFLFSCNRPATESSGAAVVQPLAIVQAGEFPLWFQFTDAPSGEVVPVLLETIEDACFSAALIPWPLAPHVRFMLAQDASSGEELVMAVNRDGFIRFSLWQGQGAPAEKIGLYHISGREWWRQYTVGAFILYDAQPAALLYRDDRFFDSDAPVPAVRLWTLDQYASRPKTLAMPLLDAFPPEDGWDIDALRHGSDGYWYFRAVRKMAAPPVIRMFRSNLADASSPASASEQVSLGDFQNAALPAPLAAAPAPLQKMLSAVFAHSGSGIAAVVSPEFHSTRYFAVDREKTAILGFYTGRPEHPFLVAIQPQGAGFYIKETDISPIIQQFSLPPLPDGFVYTGIGMVGNTIIAAWEEQDGHSIGAAGFMVISLII
ncbi:MAG: hypothetical protein FWD36_04720 [Treponema sp.]|nr:hypothetical protein [Treponema sp.]